MGPEAQKREGHNGIESQPEGDVKFNLTTKGNLTFIRYWAKLPLVVKKCHQSSKNLQFVGYSHKMRAILSDFFKVFYYRLFQLFCC